MKIIKITDMNNIPTIENNVTIEVKDRHNGGTRTIDITGFWNINNERLAIDIGERMHCLNEVCIGNNKIELGTSSIGGSYCPAGEYRGNGFNDVVERIVIEENDTMEDIKDFYFNFVRDAVRRKRKAK